MKQTLVFLITIALSISACSDDQESPEQTTKPATSQGAPVVEQSTSQTHRDPVDRERPSAADKREGILYQSKEMANKAVKKGKEYSAIAVDKSKELYQSAKEAGSGAGVVIGDKSREVWDKTRELGREAVEDSQEVYEGAKEQAGEWGDALREKSQQIYEQATEDTE